MKLIRHIAKYMEKNAGITKPINTKMITLHFSTQRAALPPSFTISHHRLMVVSIIKVIMWHLFLAADQFRFCFITDIL